MKATELRIGNIVGMALKKYPWNWFVILEVADSNIKTTDNWKNPYQRGSETSFYQPEDLEGIPITKDWLKDFGFKQEINDVVWDKHENGFTIHFERNDGHLECYLESVGIEIEYVHQLQNLYFSLTGEELTIKTSNGKQ